MLKFAPNIPHQASFMGSTYGLCNFLQDNGHILLLQPWTIGKHQVAYALCADVPVYRCICPDFLEAPWAELLDNLYCKNRYCAWIYLPSAIYPSHWDPNAFATSLGHLFTELSMKIHITLGSQSIREVLRAFLHGLSMVMHDLSQWFCPWIVHEFN